MLSIIKRPCYLFLSVLCVCQASYAADVVLSTTAEPSETGNGALENLPQYEVDKINDFFSGAYLITLECSEGSAFPKFQLFGQGNKIYLLKDSNSTLGFSVAELQAAKDGQYYHREGLRYLTANSGTATDIFVSAETLVKGTAALTVLLYGKLYNCEAMLKSSPTEEAEQRITTAIERANERNIAQTKLRELGAQVGILIEQAIHRELWLYFEPVYNLAPNTYAILKLRIGTSGEFVGIQIAASSGNSTFDLRARQAASKLGSINNINLNDLPESEFRRIGDEASSIAETVGMPPPSIEELLDQEHFFYIRVDSSRVFTSVPPEKRD